MSETVRSIVRRDTYLPGVREHREPCFLWRDIKERGEGQYAITYSTYSYRGCSVIC